MSLTFDRETIEKGLRRAAEMAKHGTREEQSGKFLPPPGWKGHLVTADDAPPAPKTKRA
ncbi:MAG: hypothetical protein ACRED4_09580 [Brevundimonas sp.]